MSGDDFDFDPDACEARRQADFKAWDAESTRSQSERDAFLRGWNSGWLAQRDLGAPRRLTAQEVEGIGRSVHADFAAAISEAQAEGELLDRLSEARSRSRV